MGKMSAETKDITRPPETAEEEILHPYSESDFQSPPLTIEMLCQNRDQRILSGANTNCNNDENTTCSNDEPTSIISDDPTSSSDIDAFSSSCEADLEISVHIPDDISECPYQSVDRKYRKKISSYFGGTENTNQSNQTNSGSLAVPEGSDSVINVGYSSIDRFRVNGKSAEKKSSTAVPIAPVKELKEDTLVPIKEEKVQSVPERTPIRTESKPTDLSVKRLREINANNVLPGKVIRVNSMDGHNSVGSSNSSVNLIRQGSNCSDFSINTSRTRLIRKDRVKWGTLDHRKLEEVTPSKFVNGRFENPWDTWQEPTFGRVCRWFCSAEHRNIPSQTVS